MFQHRPKGRSGIAFDMNDFRVRQHREDKANPAKIQGHFVDHIALFDA